MPSNPALPATSISLAIPSFSPRRVAVFKQNTKPPARPGVAVSDSAGRAVAQPPATAAPTNTPARANARRRDSFCAFKAINSIGSGALSISKESPCLCAVSNQIVSFDLTVLEVKRTEVRAPFCLRLRQPAGIAPRRSPLTAALQLPTGPIRRGEELIGLFRIRKSHARRIPLQLRARKPDRDHTQQSDLRERPAVGGKIGAGPGAGADCLQPVPMMFFDPGNSLRRAFVLIHFFLRYDPHAARPMRAVDDGALVPEHNRASFNILLVCLHVLRARYPFSAAVPVQRDRTA